MKGILASLAALLILVLGVALLVWSYPEKILTSERVSGWAASVVRVERTPDSPFANAPLVNLEIATQGLLNRSLAFRFMPGCYSLVAEAPGGTEVCIETANLVFSFRLSRSTYFKLTSLDRFELKVTRGKYVAPKTEKSKEKSDEPSTGMNDLRYLSRGFYWGPIEIDVDRFDVPASDLKVAAKIHSTEVGARGKARSPKLAMDIKADAPEWIAELGGEMYEEGQTLVLPNASVAYRTKQKKSGSAPLKLGGEVGARYGLESGDLDASFSVNWRNPTPEIESLKAEDGVFRMRKEELSARTTVKALLQGKTPLGRLPIVTIDLAAAMRPADQRGARPIDFDFKIDAFEFAGIKAHSDLAVTLSPAKGKNELLWRKGELRVETPDLGKTIRLLSRTAWAIPVPFNVFHGPVVFRTEPFRITSDRSTIPATLHTDLQSTEQAFVTETHAEIDFARKDFAILGVRVNALIKKAQFRLPDYDPISPAPALARDPRILRADSPAPRGKNAPPAPKPSATAKAAENFPLAITIKGAPGSIVLLNRFFKPSLTAGVDLVTVPETGAFKGSVALSSPFGIKYLNREITLEQLQFLLRPSLEVSALVTMERSGYKIRAQVAQAAGKTHIELGSEPPLEEGEIVSLMIYGMPKNSISSEQTRSVGSAQSAIQSDALGVFSFWAFASTPIESVLYDPETQTYSAVVSLPGGVTAAIGSNWENERQLALSKSLGRNWAVSTELIQDPEGVDRGGTLLRWRKSY